MKGNKYGIVVHGGAGTILKSKMTAEKEAAYTAGLQEALNVGFQQLENGASACSAVETAIVALENNPLFNAGRGAVFNSVGQHEMDASIMDGKNLDAGAITSVRNLKNPIKLATTVMKHSNHVLLTGDGAKAFAQDFDIEFEEDAYFFDHHRYEQWQKIKGSENFQLDHTEKEKKYLGTVGAVALDKAGNISAGTSTGGMTNKKFGRIGDSPIIGAGTYADNRTCAVSCTGSGEYFMRAVTAYHVSCLIENKAVALQEAAQGAIDKLTSINGDGGLIAINTKGEISMPFNCDGMYRGFKNTKESIVLIYK